MCTTAFITTVYLHTSCLYVSLLSSYASSLHSYTQDASQHGDGSSFSLSALHINTTPTNTVTNTTNTTITTNKKRGVYSSVNTASSTDLSGIEMSNGNNSPNAYERKHNTTSGSIWSYLPTIWGAKTSKSSKKSRNGSDEKLHTTHSPRAHTTQYATHANTTPKSNTTYHSVSNKNNSIYTATDNTKSYIGAVQHITKRGISNAHNVSSNSIDGDDMYL